MIKFFRQGDICFEELDEIPEGLVYKGTEVKIRGEQEGHIHQLGGVQVLIPPEQEEQVPVFVVVSASTAVMVHEEHEPLTLPKGVFRVTQFQEYENPQRVD